ncbi:RHS repeat domain-containing protein [Flavobacterium chungangensis]|uniref:RHS repeat domain-containing protein n=1 Tax=Flavobacterium chungangensis TaxID=2708132 RepID=A0ABV8ZBJ1_9FLAO
MERAGESFSGVKVNYDAKYKKSLDVVKANYATFEVPYYGVDNNDYVNGLGFCCNPAITDGSSSSSSTTGKMTAKNDNAELQQFYYHPDHLGSSSYISNLDGEVVQHVEYVPFGEIFLEEKNAKWNTPYLFTSKELDRETGLYYFGARYQDPKLGIFISVDPLAEKYRGCSSYSYALNNPVIFTDPTGMSAEPPVNGLSYFRDDTGEYFWNDNKNSYEHYADPNGSGSNSFQGYYVANKFSDVVGNYNIIFDLSNTNTKDEFDRNHTITAISDGVYSYLNARSIIDGVTIQNISDPDKYPGVEIYSSPYMNGALTAGNVIFTNPGMQGANTLDHEYGHYLDFKHHFKYNKSEYAKTIAVPSFFSALTSSVFPTLYDHESSDSEKRANRLGGAWSNNRILKTR